MTLADETPQYQGKPTAYLDQNILDLFVSHGLGGFSEELMSKFQVVYSDETLNEIKRSGDYSRKFLSVLKDLKAHHLKLVLEQPGFISTDKATLTNRDPYEAYQEYCENAPEYNDVQYAMEQWLFKFSGGRVGDGISEIHNEQKKAFSDLMNQLKSQVSEISEEIPDLENMFGDYENLMKLQLEGALDETERLMKENILDDKNWSGIKDFRNAAGVGPKQLNNITPPDILKKIWDKFRTLPPYNTMDIGIEEFFGLNENPIYPDQPYFKHQKVTGIYNMLNTLGYYPDSKVHKERRFVASLSDTSHASIASFCNVLFSRDEAFVKKVEAAYEYLGIPTLVKYVVVKIPST